MVRSRLLVILVVGSALAAPAALAQPSSPEAGDARFTFHRADDGYLRLDGRTGEVSVCHHRAARWQCQLVPDERTALESEIARLQSDNAVLKKELLSRSLPLPNGMRPDQPAPKSTAPGSPKSDAERPQLPDDAEINRVMSVIEKVWRRLIEMVASLRRDLQERI